jgi:predicted extracellular nuclease
VNGGDSAPRSRPALAQAFLDLETGVQLIVSPNHLKSKGSACDAPDTGDGQGNCAVVRTNAANLLADWLLADPTNSGTENVLIVGDLNSYAKEDPIAALEGAGFTNLVAAEIGTDAYSFVFDGQWGYLDHAMGNDAIVPDVTGVAEWHINADEPNVLDYNDDFKSPGQIVSLYAPDEFRVSDHDPVVVGLSPTVTYSSVCTLTKEFVTQPGIANALCAKLAAAAAADERGKELELQNFVNQVEAQSGKALTATQAATLIGLAGNL